jgi:hypothetical protein
MLNSQEGLLDGQGMMLVCRGTMLSVLGHGLFVHVLSFWMSQNSDRSED